METKEKILQSFTEEVTVKGFAALRISTLCKQLSIDRKLFYYYFQDKYAVLEEIYQRDLNDTFASEQTTKENWQEHAQMLLAIYREKGSFYPVCIAEDEGLWRRLFEAHMQNLFLNLFVELAAQEENNLEFYADFYANGWTGLVTRWINQRSGLSRLSDS